MESNPLTPMVPAEADYVIVGAGVAGLYCAWRLITKYPDKKIVVVDRLNRTGGRLDSDVIEYAGGAVREEQGGMRFVSTHKILLELFAALDHCKELVPFLMSDPTEHNRRYYRGHGFTLKEAGADDHAIWGTLYNLAPEGSEPQERGLAPTAILANAYTEILRKNGHPTPPVNPTPEFWEAVRLEFEWNGTPLNRWQIWGLLSDMGYSNECITMLSETVGFQGPIFDMANAGVALQLLMDFPENPEFYTAELGFGSIPDALRDDFHKRGGILLLETELIEVRDAKDGGYELRFAPAGDDRTGVGFGVPFDSLTAPNAILAVPSGPLQTLYMRSPALHAQDGTQDLLIDIRSVVGLPLLKINLFYDRPWWEDGVFDIPPFEAGPCFTDLPLNALYPFGSIKGERPEDEPAAMTIYCDSHKIHHWHGLQNIGRMFDSPLQQDNAGPPRTIFPASEAVVREATRMMETMFGVSGLPQPVMTSYRLWTDEGLYGAAYHQWGLNVNDAEVRERLTEPRPGLFIAGEAYSDEQGWVEGALRSAEVVLAKLGIPSLTTENRDPCALPLHPMARSDDQPAPVPPTSHQAAQEKT